MTPMVAPARTHCIHHVPGCTCLDALDELYDCATCEDTGLVEAWQPHDGSDYPDKKGWLEMRMVPCPDCERRTARHEA